METIRSPFNPAAASILYEVTLPSGMIITNPSGFGEELQAKPQPCVIVTDDGRVIFATSIGEQVKTFIPTYFPPLL